MMTDSNDFERPKFISREQAAKTNANSDPVFDGNREHLPIMKETVKLSLGEAIQPHIDHGTTIVRNISCMTGILKQLLSAMPETDNLEASLCLLKSISENQEALNGLLRKALARSKMKISGDAVRNFTGGYC